MCQLPHYILQCNLIVNLPILQPFALLATFFFLDFDLENAVHSGYFGSTGRFISFMGTYQA